MLFVKTSEAITDVFPANDQCGWSGDPQIIPSWRPLGFHV